LKRIYVVAGLLERGSQVLLDRRKAGTHLEGLWEFPGGKREVGETDHQALIRELAEELGVVVTEVGSKVAEVHHRYAGRDDADPELDLTLVLYAVRWTGEPAAIEVAEVRWFERAELRTVPMPPADVPLVEAILSASNT